MFKAPTISRLAMNAARIIPMVLMRLRLGYITTSRYSRLIRIMKGAGQPWLSHLHRSTQFESAFQTSRWMNRKEDDGTPFKLLLLHGISGNDCDARVTFFFCFS